MKRARSKVVKGEEMIGGVWFSDDGSGTTEDGGLFTSVNRS